MLVLVVEGFIDSLIHLVFLFCIDWEALVLGLSMLCKCVKECGFVYLGIVEYYCVQCS